MLEHSPFHLVGIEGLGEVPDEEPCRASAACGVLDTNKYVCISIEVEVMKLGNTSINILDFVSRMFLGASAMLDLQATELGYQIALQPQEIGDLAGFVYDSEAQAEFSYAEVPVPLQDWILNEPYWEFEEWPEDLPEIYPDLENGSKQ